MRATIENSKERLERSKLRIFYEDVIRRQLDRKGASSSTLERHDAAVEHLERFVKKPLSPGEVDEELVAKFDSYLWRQGTSNDRRRHLTESLLRICRAYNPSSSVFTKRCQRRLLPDPPPGSLRYFYETIDIPQRLTGRTARYIDENRAAFWRLYEHYGRDIMLAELNDALAADHLRWLLDQGLKASSVNSGHKAPLFATWRYACELGLIDRRPTLRQLPETRDEPDSWSVDEVKRLFAACQSNWKRPKGGRIGGVPAADWWEALLRVAWYTALRRRAIMGLRHADVDLRSCWLRVPGSLMKGGLGQTFKLGPDAVAAIARIWDPTRDLLFPFPYTKGIFYDWFNAIAFEAQLPRGRRNAGALHKIRRSAATTVAHSRGIVAAQTILGHSDQKTTRRYLDPSKLPGADFSDLLSAVNRKAEPPATVG